MPEPSQWATPAGCSDPGRLFESPNDAGLCTNSIDRLDTLSNAEIADRIAKNNLTPIHHTNAAVNAIAWGDQWVAYDDKDTYEQQA
jgi:hypothetical protein